MRISGLSACQQATDFINDLEKGIVENKDKKYHNKINKIPSSLHLRLKFIGIEALAILDTGSQVTAVSEMFDQKLKNKKKILEMPVSNIVVSTAIGKKVRP